MRLLGVDFGFKRIGLAVGESSPQVVAPRPTLTASGALKRDAEAIDRVARTEAVERIVVGAPLEDGEPGRMARICETLAGHLRGLGWTVETVDETLTSVSAEEALRDQGHRASVRRRMRDGEAACQILERYLHERPTT